MGLELERTRRSRPEAAGRFGEDGPLQRDRRRMPMGNSRAAPCPDRGTALVRRAVRPAVFSAFALLFAFVSLLPVAWMFKTNAVGRIVNPGELLVPPPEVFPGGFSLLPYISVLYDLDFLRPLANGVITAATTAVGCLLIGSMAAYTIARRGFRPGVIVMTLVLAMGLLLPFATPGVLTTAVLTFVFAWNQYLFARNPAFEEKLRPIAAVLPEVPNDFLPAVSVLVTLPLVALVLGYGRLDVAGSAVGETHAPPATERPAARPLRVAPGVATAVLL